MKRIIIILIVALSNIGFAYSQTHFVKNWSGNGFDQMNFYALTATINGANLQNGDEIAVFDGANCVGVSLVTGSGVVSLVASKDDPVSGNVDGYISDHTATIKMWDNSEQKEVTDIDVNIIAGNMQFNVGATTQFNLVGRVACTPPASPTVEVSQPTCGGSTGMITVTAPTGSGFTYSINGSTYTNTTGIFSGVAIGTYTVTARNTDGCTSSGTSAPISANPIPSAPTISLTQPACGVSTGTITITAPTGSGMTYSIDGSTYTNTTGMFSGVAIGTYTVTVRSSGGCTSSGTSATLNANPVPSAPTVSLTQPSCGVSTGTITITAPTGSGMTYSINGSTYTNTTGIFSGVSVGTYTVTVRSSGGCTSSGTSATINANPNPSAPTVSLTQPSCGGSTGTITITAPTGSGMTYSIDGSTYTNTTGIFSGVALGTYTVTARSSGGCTSSGTSATLNANPVPAAPTVSLTQPACGASTGTITITAPTGSGMTYSINGSTYTNTSGVFSGVATGTYAVTARSSGACTSSGTSAILNANPNPSAPTVSLTQPSCGGSTGTITVTAPTGSGLTYSINGSTYTNTTGIFSGVAIGTYSVTVRNSGGCTSSGTSATLNANPVPAAPTVSLTQPTCGASNGTLTITAPTGSGMTYSIDGSTYTNTTGIFSGVAIGTYTVTARSSGVCTSSGTSVTLNANPVPAAPTVSLTQPSCGVSTGTITITAPTGSGMTYSINGSTYTNTTGIFSVVSSGTYTVTARSSGGCTSSGTSATINANPNPSAPTVSLTQPSCGGSTGTITITAPTGSGMTYSIDGSTYTNTTGIFSGVALGTYTVTARSSGGCTSSGTSATLNANPVPAAPTVSLTQPACGASTGTITITAPTGSGMTYSINGSTYTNTSGVFSGVATGTYTVTARSSGACTSSGTSATLNANPVPAAPTVSMVQPTCATATGIITITAPLGTGMTYSINGSTYTNTNGIFPGVTSGTYTVTARNSDGCTSSGASAVINTQPATPATPVITQNSNLLTSSATVGNQWYTSASGLIPGATQQNYSMQSNGDYYVTVTINGCTSAASNIISFATGIEKNEAFKGILIYPNPAHDKLIIENDNYLVPIDFDIMNSNGKIIYNSILNDENKIDLSQFSSGIYFIRFSEKGSYYILKFIKE